MKNRVALFLVAFFAMVALGGCGEEPVPLSEMKTDKYVKLGEYKGLEVTVAPAMEVTEDYKQNYIDYVRRSKSQWVDMPEETEAKQGDVVNIDFEGKIGGEPFEGGSGAGYDLQLGSHSFIEGFEEGLVGACAGETKDLQLHFPDPYPDNPDLSGVAVTFTVTVNSLQRNEVPELTDAYVKSLNVNCDTVEEYQAYVTDLLEEYVQSTYENNVEEALVNKAMEGCTFKEPPKFMVDEYYDRVVRNMTKIASDSGMTLEQLITGYYQSDMEEFEEEAREGAKESCKESIMLQAIANREGITVSQEEIDAILQEGVEKGGYESVDALKQDMGKDNFEDDVMCDKVLALLKENAIILENTTGIE